METTPGVDNICPNVLQGASAHMFLMLINTLINAKCGLGPEGHYPTNYASQLKDGDEFDFIIVGAGSAGCVIANRLSEVPEWKILLLEAGGYPSGMSEIPGLLFSLQGTEEDWQYEMESTGMCCLSQKDGKCRCPRGKGIGGSSLINAMLYTRSTRYDHESWTKNGNDGWDYESVVKYYNKLENAHHENNHEYGTEGELHLTQYTNTHPIRKILQKAYEDLGYTQYSEDKPHGFKDMLLSIYKGTRQNSAKAFLSPIKNRKNLYVASGAYVTRVLATNNHVNGVQVKINQQIITIKAKNEVILSAGTINSPQILMSSGIGPKEHISHLGIQVIKDMPVGNNFQDHAALAALAIKLDKSAFTAESPLHIIDEIYQFFMHREGALTRIEITNFGTFINTKPGSKFANIEYIHVAIRLQEQYLLEEVIRCMRIPDGLAKSLRDYNQNSPLLLIFPVLLLPKSKGLIHLQNSDPFEKPLITPNFLSDENGEDIKAFLSAIKIIQDLIKTDSFAPYHPELINPNIINCTEFESQSDDYWRCTIRHATSTLYHPIGTCKMGPKSDPMAVVDPRLKVHGIRGIRVIDGSIIPHAPSCNTNALIMMIGEKGSDIIKDDWLVQKRDEL